MAESETPKNCNADDVRAFQAFYVRPDGVVIPCGNPHEMQEGAEWTAVELSKAWPGAEYGVAAVLIWRQ